MAVIMAQTPQELLPAGSNLSILAKAKELGGVMHQLQPAIIPELIARFGNGWHCAAINKELPSILSHAVPCHVLSCVLVDVHVREMSSVRCGHFDHRRGGVQ